MNIRSTWAHLSIRSKTLVWLGAVTLVMLTMMAVSGSMRNRIMLELTRLQDNDTRCYAVQSALTRERDTLEQLLDTRAQTDLQVYRDACAASEQALDALPNGYSSLGEERSARTWNLQQGYEGYRESRDALLAMSPDDPGFSAEHYRVLEMLDDLSL